MSGQECYSCKESRLFMNIAYIYITLPFIIFVIGWIKWYYAIIIVTCVIGTLIKMMCITDPLWIPEFNKNNVLKILIIVMVIFLIVYLSGIGNLVWQNFDHATRNAMFRILVEEEWPLISYEWNPNGSGLIYYIGFWLPSAVVGKITNLNFGYYFQFIWAIIGVCIVYFLICSWLKKLLVWPLFIFLFFSGLDIIGFSIIRGIVGNFTLTSHIEWWAYRYQFSSTITQLFWVFNQSIPTWCITILLYLQKNSKNLIFLLALSMLSSTIPFIGLIPFVIYFTITKGGNYLSNVSRKNIINKLKVIFEQVCSIQNIIGGGIVGIISFLYLRGNSASQYINVANDFNNIIDFLLYYLFCFLEAGIYILLVYQYQQKNSLFYIVGISLFLVPLITVGTSVDFCMRASIPALFILILLIIDTIIKAQNVKDTKMIAYIIVILLIGSITPALEINRTIYETYSSIKKEGKIVNDEDSRKDVYSELNISGVKYSGEINDNIFYELFVK